jgi:hypothetical protein
MRPDLGRIEHDATEQAAAYDTAETVEAILAVAGPDADLVELFIAKLWR